MFQYLQSGLTKYTPSTIDISDLVKLIKAPKRQTLKTRMPAYMPHGEFDNLLDHGLNSYSGYLFIDIDNVSNIEHMKSTLILMGASLAYRSVGGNGVHALFKAELLSSTNDFYLSYDALVYRLTQAGIDVDKHAKGLSRKAVIGMDSEPYTGEGVISYNTTDEIHITPNDTLLTSTPVDFPNNQQYLVTPVENYVRVWIPKDIPDGQKHKTYRKAIVDLLYLNPDATNKAIFDFMSLANARLSTNKMIQSKLRQLVYSWAEHIRQNDIRPKPRTKWVHFNRTSKLTIKQKQSIAAKETAIRKTKKTSQIINTFRADNDYKPTQAECSKALGISLSTVKRYW